MIGMKVLSILISTAMLTGCGAAAGADGGTEAQSSVVQTEEVAASALSDIANTDDMFSSRDLDPGYDESQAVTVRLTGDTAVCDSDAVTVDGGTVTITAAGTYVLSGTLTDGQIVVRAGEADKVQLVLNGVDITCSDSAAIYALEADKVFLTLADGTENSLTNGGTYAAIDENNIDAVIFAKTDLTLNGTGSLTVSAAAGHGIVCKDDLVIAGGTCTIDAASHGIEGKDSVRIAGGTLVITAGKDGIHAENDDDAEAGWLYILDGSLTIHAGDDAIHSGSDVVIRGGSFDIPSCCEGVEGRSVTIDGGTLNIVSSDDGINAAGSTDSSDFTAGGGDFAYNAACSVVVSGGSITIMSQGDCIDANGDITVNGGTLELTCGGNGNTALDCNGAYTNNGGTVTTNDGSESGMGMGGPMGGQMGGMAPGGGQMGGMAPGGGQMGGTPPGGGQMGGTPPGGGQVGGTPPGGGRPDMRSTDSSAAAA